MLYACPVWAKVLNIKATNRMLTSTYRLSALKLICGFRSTSDDTSLVLASLILINIMTMRCLQQTPWKDKHRGGKERRASCFKANMASTVGKHHKYSIMDWKTWQVIFLYEPISGRSRMFQKIFAQICTCLDQEEDAKYVFFDCPRYCRYIPSLHGPLETTPNPTSSDVKWTQVRTNIGLADTLIPSSFIYLIYMGDTGHCDSIKIILGYHVNS